MMNSEERPHTIGSSCALTTPMSSTPITAMPCRKTLFRKQQSPLMRIDNYEGCGNPSIKTACSCNCSGQNWINRSPHHTHLCRPTIKNVSLNRSRHCSGRNGERGNNGRRQHPSGGFNLTEEDVSKLIIDEDLLDVIFFKCDINKTGNVPVSLLIESVCNIMLPSHLEEVGIIGY